MGFFDIVISKKLYSPNKLFVYNEIIEGDHDIDKSKIELVKIRNLPFRCINIIYGPIEEFGSTVMTLVSELHTWKEVYISLSDSIENLNLILTINIIF
jgi:hypothetical protein